MPTWAITRLTIEGSDEEIHRFVHALEPRFLDEYGNERWSIMNSFLPCPRALREVLSRFRKAGKEGPEHDTPQEAQCRAHYGFTDWHQRNLAVWGCKWADVVQRVEIGPGRLDLLLKSPAVPPLIGLTTIFAKFPSFRVELHWTDTVSGLRGGDGRWDGAQWLTTDEQGLLNNADDLDDPEFNASQSDGAFRGPGADDPTFDAD